MKDSYPTMTALPQATQGQCAICEESVQMLVTVDTELTTVLEGQAVPGAICRPCVPGVMVADRMLRRHAFERPGRVVPSVIGLVILLLACGIQAATITGTLRDLSGNAYVTNALFKPLSTPLADGAGIIASKATNVMADASGNLSVVLKQGDYQVTVGGQARDSFIISVPNTNASFEITALITQELTYNFPNAPSNEVLSNKGQAGGYAPLDTNGFIPRAQIPQYVITNVVYPGDNLSNAFVRLPSNARLIVEQGIWPIPRLGSLQAPLNLIGRSNIVVEFRGAVISNTTPNIPGPLITVGTNDVMRITGLTSYSGGVVNTNSFVFGEIDAGSAGLTTHNSVVDNCFFYDACNHGIILAGTNISALRNTLHRGGDTNHNFLGVDGAAVVLSGANCRAEENNIDLYARGIELQCNHPTRISGWILKNKITRTTGDWDIGVIGTVGGTQDGLFIDDNIIERDPFVVATNLFALQAIAVTSASNVFIRGNSFLRATLGFAGVFDGLVLKGNTWRAARSTALAISVTGYRAIAHGNYFLDCETVAVAVFAGDNHFFEDNHVINIGGTAFWVPGTVTNTTIIRNHIVDTRVPPSTDAGILIGSSSKGAIIIDNFYYRLAANLQDQGTGTIKGSPLLYNDDALETMFPAGSFLTWSGNTMIYAEEGILRITNDDFNALTHLGFSWDPGDAVIRPNATQLVIRDGNDSTDLDLGVRDIYASGDLLIGVAGKGIRIKEGSNARMGTVTLASGIATVSTTAIAASSRVQLTLWATANAVNAIGVTNKVNGTSFQIRSTSNSDGNRVDWLIIDPAP